MLLYVDKCHQFMWFFPFNYVNVTKFVTYMEEILNLCTSESTRVKILFLRLLRLIFVLRLITFMEFSYVFPLPRQFL